jgi:hypothetical protein
LKLERSNKKISQRRTMNTAPATIVQPNMTLQNDLLLRALRKETVGKATRVDDAAGRKIPT